NTLKADGVLSRGTPSFNVCLGTIYLGDTHGNAYGSGNSGLRWQGKKTTASPDGLAIVMTDTSLIGVSRFWGVPALCGAAGLRPSDPCIFKQTKQKSDITALVNQGILAAGADTNMHDADL